MLKEIEKFAKEIAYESGEILLKGFRSADMKISYKSRTDLVTNIDKASEDFLYKKVSEKYPDHTIIAEEGSYQDGDGEFVWYIDPLDATNNFAHGIPYFCVSIGIYSHHLKRVVVGVVYDPFHDECYSGILGDGAKLNEEIIHVSTKEEIGISMISTGFPYEKEDPEKNNLKQFSKFLPKVQGIRRIGSAALDLCYLAVGRFDGFWEPELKSWDMAAGSLIVEEAGGKVTNYAGEHFDPLVPEIVASNGIIHNRMIQILQDVE